MSTRCNVKITTPVTSTTYLYHHSDGFPEDVGAIVAIAARNLLEGKIEASDITQWFCEKCPNWNFRLTEGVHGDIEYFYHIDIKRSGDVKIGYSYGPSYLGLDLEGNTRNYQVKTFISRIVNVARRRFPDYKMLRLPTYKRTVTPKHLLFVIDEGKKVPDFDR